MASACPSHKPDSEQTVGSSTHHSRTTTPSGSEQGFPRKSNEQQVLLCRAYWRKQTYLKMQLIKMRADVHFARGLRWKTWTLHVVLEHRQEGPEEHRQIPEGSAARRSAQKEQRGDYSQPRPVKSFPFSFLPFSLRNLLTQFLNEVEIDVYNSTPQSNIHLC